ncbi:MAG: hypothetical protein ACFCU9_02265, partial [Cyanophyceae cyanobacterium]
PCLDCDPNSFMDPNYKSYDNLYSFSDATGVFILSRRLDGRVEVQACQDIARSVQTDDPIGDRNVDIAIRSGANKVEFNIANSAPGTDLVRINGNNVRFDVGENVGLPGLTVLRESSFFYTVRTAAGDAFRLYSTGSTLNLYSSPATPSGYEGILGNFDGSRLNDWTPRGGMPLNTDTYRTVDFRDFVESWRVDPAQDDTSLQSIPCSGSQTSDPWRNKLEDDELRFGFDEFRRLIGEPLDDPYLAFRFAVDLAAGIPVEELVEVYEPLQGDEPPRPPVDADLNKDGTPDVEESELWNFGDIVCFFGTPNFCNSPIDDNTQAQ